MAGCNSPGRAHTCVQNERSEHVELSEPDLCIIEANYLDVLSDLERRLIEELRAARARADKNDAAADEVVEMRREIQSLEERIEDLENGVQSAQDDARLSRERGDELQKEVDGLEDKLTKLREVLG